MRKINKVLLIILCIIICTNKIYAASGSFTDIWSSGSSGSSPPPSDPNPGGIDGRGSTGREVYQNNGRTYRCYYKHSIVNNTALDINAYDMNGTSLIPNTLKTDNKFKSGTWIGINATEIKTASWSINSFKYYEVKKSYSCHYQRNGTSTVVHTSSCFNTQNLNCQNYLNQYGSRYGANRYRTENCTGTTIRGSEYSGKKCKLLYVVSEVDIWVQQPQTVSVNSTITTRNCPKYNGLNADEVRIDNNNIEEETSPISECRNNAINDIENQAKQRVGSASNKLEYETSNKSSSSKKVTIDATKKYPQVQSEKTQSTTSASGRAWQEYEYTPQKVCINVLTAEIKYNNECNTSNTNIKQINNSTVFDEYLNKTVSYWHYFIPMDAKTNSEILLSMIANTSRDSNNNLIPTLTKNQCLSGMESHPNDYMDYIKPRDGNFVGDYSKGTRSNDIKRVQNENGCFVAIVLRFKTTQKFYSEEKKSGYTSLKGYNAYFRQIDINNPFPNGIDNNSIWKGLYNSTTKKVNTGKEEIKLSSFDNITYIAEISNQNANKIRTFNNDTSYTKWVKDYGKQNGMNANGTSNFIRNGSTSSIFTTKSSLRKDSPYKLGCGPANYNAWGSWCKS